MSIEKMASMISDNILKEAGILAPPEKDRLPNVETYNLFTGKKMAPSIYDEVRDGTTDLGDEFINVSDIVPARALTPKYHVAKEGGELLQGLAGIGALASPFVGGSVAKGAVEVADLAEATKGRKFAAGASGFVAGTAATLGASAILGILSGHADNAASNELRKRLPAESADKLMTMKSNMRDQIEKDYQNTSASKEAGYQAFYDVMEKQAEISDDEIEWFDGLPAYKRGPIQTSAMNAALSKAQLAANEDVKEKASLPDKILSGLGGAAAGSGVGLMSGLYLGRGDKAATLASAGLGAVGGGILGVHKANVNASNAKREEIANEVFGKEFQNYLEPYIKENYTSKEAGYQAFYTVMEKQAFGPAAIGTAIKAGAKLIKPAATAVTKGVKSGAEAMGKVVTTGKDAIKMQSFAKKNPLTPGLGEAKQIINKNFTDAGVAALKNPALQMGAVGAGSYQLGKSNSQEINPQKLANDLIDAMIIKQAAVETMAETTMVAEASERALGSIGYQL